MIHKSNQKITIMNKIMATRLTLIMYLDIMPKFLSVSQKMNITLFLHGRPVRGWATATVLWCKIQGLTTPGACSNSYPSSRWCHPTISLSVVPFFLLPSIFPSIRAFSNGSVLIRWPKYWSFSFSISPSDEYSGLISFMIDWINLLAVQGTLRSLFQHHS